MITERRHNGDILYTREATNVGKYENIKDHGFDKMEPERQRELARAAGKASVESKRRRKMIAEVMTEALDKADESGMTVQEKGVLAVLRKYSRGDLRAFELVRDTIGEKPTERVELKANVDTAVCEMEEYFREKACEKKSST